MTLVVRKILASSSFAIASTLSSLIHRLEAVIREDDEKLAQAQQDLDDQYDDLDDLKEELEVLEPESKFVLSDEHKSQVNAEIDELRHFYDKAVGITNNAKGAALLIAIEKLLKESVNSEETAKLLYLLNRHVRKSIFLNFLAITATAVKLHCSMVVTQTPHQKIFTRLMPRNMLEAAN